PHASTIMPYPTLFRSARGITTETEVGTAAADVMSTLPLLTRPVTPRFFVVGDRVTLASVINNNTASAQTVEATLESSGVTVESEDRKSTRLNSSHVKI